MFVIFCKNSGLLGWYIVVLIMLSGLNSIFFVNLGNVFLVRFFSVICIIM